MTKVILLPDLAPTITPQDQNNCLIGTNVFLFTQDSIRKYKKWADFRLGRLKFNWRGAWQASTSYVIDDIVSFKGNTYVCVVNHTSAADETQWATTDLNVGTPKWELHTPGVRNLGPWGPNTFYAVNDIISYGANQYICVTDSHFICN